jgi:hypothetical protein
VLIQLTGFNPLHPTDDDQQVEIESKDISSVVSSVTGDRKAYTTITTENGELFFVKETVSQVNEKIEEA